MVNTSARPRSGARAEPAADQLDARPGGHERDGDELRDRADQERRQRRRRHLHALRESEHPALALEGHHLLQHGLLRGLGEGHQAEPDEHAHREQQDPRAQREHARHGPHDDVDRQQRAQRVRAQPAPRDDQAADDEPRAEHAEQQPPDLDRHEREPVGVEQGHEHPAEEVVERGEGDEPEQAGDGRDDGDRAAQVQPVRSASRRRSRRPGRPGCGSRPDARSQRP